MPDHEHFLAIIDKLDKISEDVAEIKVMDAIQNEQLKEHMRRTDILEQQIDKIDGRVKPIETHVHHLAGILKLVTWASILVSILLSIKEVFWP